MICVLVWYNNSEFTPLGYLLAKISFDLFRQEYDEMKWNIFLLRPCRKKGQDLGLGLRGIIGISS